MLNPFSFFGKRQSITYNHLRVLQILSFQAICMWDLEAGLSVAKKKEMACEQTHVLVSEMNIAVPDALVEAAVESSFYVLKRVSKDPESAFVTVPGSWEGKL